MTKDRIPRFGPLFWGTLTIACVLIIAYVGWRLYPSIYDIYDGWKQQSLIRELADSDSQIREKAVSQLQDRGEDLMLHLVDLLDHTDANVRAFAANETIWRQPKPQEAIKPLVRLLNDENEQVRWSAAYALGDFGLYASPDLTDEEETAVEALCMSLSDREERVREACVYALVEFGAKSARTKPAILTALGDEDMSVRLEAASGLLTIDSQYEARAVSVLVQGLSAKNAEDRRRAVYYLGNLGPRARFAVPALVDTLGDTDREIGNAAAGALADIGPDAATVVPALARTVQDDSDYLMRCDAASALSRMGPMARTAIPSLAKVLDEGGLLSEIAADAIYKIDRDAATRLGIR